MRLGKVTVIAFSLWSGVALGQPAPQLFRVKHDTYGCAYPRATAALTNRADTRLSDPGWVAFVESDGHCVPVTPRSLWRLVFKDGDLAFMTYAGTTAGPGSFYIRLDELSEPVPSQASGFSSALPEAAPPVTESGQPRPAITATPLPRPVQTQSSAADVQAQAQPLKTRAAPASPVVATAEPSKPSAPPPTPLAPNSSVSAAATSGQSQPQSGGGGAVLIACVLAVLFWLGVRKKRAPKTKAKARAPERQASRPLKATVPAPKPATVTAPALVPVASSPAVWVRYRQPVTVAGIGIPGGLIYVGGPHVRGSTPPCFIDPSLGVANIGQASSQRDMPYWPSYSEISPRCRFAYLKWLEGGRADPTAYIGYVFLFFYGLERRLFVDEADIRETGQVVGEVERLLKIYGSNKSFKGYATGLLEAAQLRLQVSSGLAGRNYIPVADAPAHQMPLGLKLAIAIRVAAGELLPFELAIAGLLALPSGTLPLSGRALEQVRPQFMHLMRSRFEEACPLGFKLVDRGGARLELLHRCATAGLTIDLLPSLSRQRLADPATLAWDKLVSLAVPVAAQLEEFVKLKERHPERAETLAALAALPRGFDADAVGPAAGRARRWLEELPKPISEVAFSDLAEHALGTRATKWTVQHYRAVSQALAAADYGLEPQPDHGNASVADDTTIFVFPDVDARLERTPFYPAALAGAELAEAVSRIDPASADAVRAGWLAEVGGRMPLSRPELQRLDARMRWLQHAKPATNRMRQKLGTVSEAERATVAKLAADAAAAAGAVAKGQIALLEKVYDEFGLDRSELYSAVHAANARRAEHTAEVVEASSVKNPPTGPNEQHPAETVRMKESNVVPLRPRPVSPELAADPVTIDEKRAASERGASTASPPARQPAEAPASRFKETVRPLAATEPVVVSEATPEPVHRIPLPPPAAVKLSPPTPPKEAAPPPVPVPQVVVPALDAERIRRIKEETVRVSSILASVFVDEVETTPASPAKASSDDALPGLDMRHAALVRALASRSGWSRAEFNTAARAGGLLPDGAMETINEWAFDRFDAPLLEDGDGFTIDTALLDEARSGTDAH